MNDGEARPGVQVDLFGGPKVLRKGAIVDLSPYQLALLAAVAAHGRRGLTRPRAGWLLWREDDTPRVRHRIRQLLHRIHATLGHPVVDRDGDLLRLAADADCDLHRYEELLARRACAEAAGLLLRGFATRLERSPSEELEDWLLARERGLLEEIRALASRKWDEASAAGLWGDARDAAEGLHMLFPEEAGVVEKLVEARARTGSVALAEEAFARYRERVRPAEVPALLVDLVERVRKLRAPARIDLGRPEPPPPLVGRGSAMRQARAIFDPVRAGHFGFVLVTGEGGIGKTRLLDELKTEALLEGFRCLHARSSEAERRIPLNSLVDALSEVDLGPHLRRLGEPWKSILGAFLPVGSMAEPLEEVPPIQEAHLSRRLLDALRFLLQEVAREEPTLLLLDDLQWADATSVTALKFIQRRWSGDPLGVIATARPELLEPDEAAGEYLALKDDLPVERIELRELSAEDGTTLVRHLVGDDVPPRAVQRLCELAGLHPLYLTELAKDYAAGRLELPAIPADQVAIPVSLQEILRVRIGRLSATALNAAGLLAVRGRAVRLDELSALTGLPLEHIADAVEELLGLRLAEIDAGRLRISHELFRSALYRHLSEPRRIVIHRAIAEALAADASDEATSGELAMHFARAGDHARAAEHGWKAGRRAMENGALAEAAYYFELVADHEGDARRQADATGELARALHLSRAIGRALPVLELASVRLRQVGAPVQALRMDIRRAEGLAEEGSARPSDLLHRLYKIKQEASGLKDWEAVALALDVELHLLHAEEDLSGIQRVFGEMRSVVANGDSPGATVARAGLALSALYGDPHEALAAARHAAQDTATSAEHRLRVLLRLLLVLHYQGRFFSEEASRAVREARQLAQATGDVLLKHSLESNLAVAHMDAGDLDGAEIYMRKARNLLGTAELSLPRCNQDLNEGELMLLRADYQAAQNCFRVAESFIGATTPPFATQLLHAGLGMCSLQLGDLATARRHEVALQPFPSRWHYDPTLIVAFKARMLERRQEYDAAWALLDAVAGSVRDRLLLSFMRLRSLQAYLALKRPEWRQEAYAQLVEAVELAATLQMPFRVAEYRHLMARLTSKR